MSNPLKLFLTPARVIKILFITALLIWAAVLTWPDQNLRLFFFDVGQGDSIFIQTPGNFQILIDGGPDQTVLERLGQVMPFYDRSLDLLILTHPHADHATGLIEVLHRYQVSEVIANPIFYQSAEYQEFQRLIDELGIPSRGLVQGQSLKLSDRVELTSWWPQAQTSFWGVEDVNRASLVLQLGYGEFSALLTGDAELGPENPELVEYLLSSENRGDSEGCPAAEHFARFFSRLRREKDDTDYLSKEVVTRSQRFGCGRGREGSPASPFTVDVLKVPHQGSKGAVTAAVLEKLKPQLAVITVGENRFGHPADETLELLNSAGAWVLRTDQAGTIEVVSNGKTWYTQAYGN